MKICGIDPGPKKSGIAVVDIVKKQATGFVWDNSHFLGKTHCLFHFCDEYALETVVPHGKYGKELFETIFVSGRIYQQITQPPIEKITTMIRRIDVLKLCPPVYKNGKKMGKPPYDV